MAVALAERVRVPYLLEVEDFPGPSERMRLSRRWCRGLVVTEADLAEELVRGFSVPGEMIAVVPPSIALPDSWPPRSWRKAACRSWELHWPRKVGRGS